MQVKTQLLEKVLKELELLSEAQQDVAANILLEFLSRQKKLSAPSILKPKSAVLEYRRRKELGDWGEATAMALLKRAGFVDVRDVNQETHNHPFGDLFAVRGDHRFLIGVKTRNPKNTGEPNPSFNISKKGRDLTSLSKHYRAELAWIAIKVQPRLKRFSAYFGTIEQITEAKDRFSIPMLDRDIRTYECLAHDETDKNMKPEWSNSIDT